MAILFVVGQPLIEREKNMENNKIKLIKKVLMLDTQKEVDSVLEFVSDAISRECDQDELDKKTFEQWKKARDDE